jgi:dienelactone hydrolase
MLVSLSLLFLPLSLAVLLPKPSGPYKLTLTNTQLTDPHRLDPWHLDTITNRRIMISRYDPIPASACRQSKKIPYMSPGVVAAEDEILEPYGWPVGVLGGIEMSICVSSTKTSHPNEKLPIVIFSPGLNTTRFYYSFLAQEVASRGYSVILIDHPFETDIVEFPDGTVAYGGYFSSENVSALNFALDVRGKDISFVIDSLGKEKEDGVVMFGQSFGGAVTAQAMRDDQRIKGGVNLDGLLFGDVVSEGFNKQPAKGKGKAQSFILWGADGHNATEDPDWHSYWSKLAEQRIWKLELSLKGGAHGSFWDMPLLADISGIRDELSPDTEEWLLDFKVPGKRTLGVVAEYLVDYFGFVFGEEEGLLSGPNKEFPEVEFLSR